MKRTVLLLLVAVFLLPSVVAMMTWEVHCSQSLFEKEDTLRENALSAALKRTEGDSSRSFLSEARQNEGKYIVKFARTLSEEKLLSYLEGTDYRLLSASEERVFSVTLTNAEAFEALVGTELLYCCEDRVLTTAAMPSDPSVGSQWEYEQMELFSAWELVTPKSDVIVAVLDTGVNRTHEELAGAMILDGYDAVEQTAGVFGDTDGHGTAVVGLIAATADNGVGTAGVAYGVTVLPVRVANDANRIYSSDLIVGIRFAADAGAKILNLSFGGHTYSAAEYDAVSYALDKGCILIAAAGNHGETEQAGQPIYPASYDGVISVGSCDAAGERLGFSQNNEQVDLLAPGEELLLLSVDENGVSAYREDKGTSYSAALVSGIAALAISALDADVRFEGGELLTLLADGRRRKHGIGYGCVSGLTAVSEANCPLIVGVENGGTYSNPVNVRFNRGSAELDGEEFFDGETVYQNGRHLLHVVDGDRRSTVIFLLSYTPASFEVSEDAQGTSITYSGGTATLDGIPYASGTAVTNAGWHLFALTDALGDVTTHQFYCDYELPAVSGVADGGIYNQPIRIRTAGEGETLLDGVPFDGEILVTADGEHVLAVSNGGNRSTYRFTLQTGVLEYENDLSRSGVISDAVHGWYAVYSEMLTGLRIYDAASGEYHGFIGTETVKGYTFADDLLYIFGEWQLTVLDPSQMLEGEPVVVSYPIRCEDFAHVGGTLYCLADGDLLLLSAEDGSTKLLFETDADEMYSDGSALWLYSSSENRFDRLENGELLSFVPQFSAAGKRKLFAAGWLFCGAYAVDLSDLSAGLQTSFLFEGYAVGYTEELLFSTDGVYRLADGVLIGSYDGAVSCVLPTEGGTFVCSLAGGIRFYPVSGDLVSYGYASVGETLLAPSSSSNVYTELLRLYGGSEPSAVYANGDFFAAVFSKERKLLLFRNGELSEEKALPFSPTGVVLNGSQFCIWNGESGTVWYNGDRFETGFVIENAFYVSDVLHLLGGGKIYRMENGVWEEIGVSADDAAGAGDTLVWLFDGRLSTRIGGRTVTVKSYADQVLTDGTYVICGRRVYFAETLISLFQLEDDAFALYDGAVLTEGGLYDLAKREFLASFDAYDCRFAALGGRVGVICYTNGAFTFSRFGYTIWEEPFLEGIPAANLINGQTAIYFDRGLAFLDGELYQEGTVIDTGGEHVFTLVLPCAVVRQFSFTVIPELEEIAFSAPIYRLAAGESGVLHVQYHPNGTASIPIVYSVAGDCIRLEADGSFLALREGEAIVTAQTEDGLYRTTCRVVVASALLRFTEESGYRVSREKGILRNVPAGTTPEVLLEQVLTEGTVTVSDSIIKTGTVLTLLSPEGDELDRLVIAVEGDVDRDGYMTLRDLLYLEEMLQNGQAFAGEIKSAADLNESGNVSDRDANLFREMLLFETGHPTRALPPEGADGLAELFLPSVIYSGDTVGVTLYLQNASDVYGISGRLYFDASALKYLDAEIYGFTAETYETDEWISFLATGEPSEGTPAVLTFRFAVTAVSEAFALRLCDCVLLCESGVFGQTEKTVTARSDVRVFDTVSVYVPGMTQPFSPGEFSYEAVVPFGTPALDYVLQYPQGYTVTVRNTVFDRLDTLDAVFTFRGTDGKSVSYTVHVMRNGIPQKPVDTTLFSLIAKEVPFSFDPSVNEYELTVPFPVSALTLEWRASDETVQVVCSDTALKAGQQNEITLTVTAESGEQTVYTLKVFREEQEDVSRPNPSPPAPQDDKPLWFIPIVILTVGGALILWMHRKDKKKAAEKAE